MPPKRIREYVGRAGVSLETLVAMAREFAVSKEAIARAFVEAHREPVALVVSRHGRVERFYHHEDFPFLPIARGEQLPADSISVDQPPPGTCSEQEEVEADTWLYTRDATRVLALTEQVIGQREGYALTLL